MSFRWVGTATGLIVLALVASACFAPPPPTPPTTTIAPAVRALQVTAGANHTCALITGGKVRCWGYNFSSELGNGSTTDSLTPVEVGGLSGATQIDAGFSHTCAVVSSGEVRCWGFGGFGQLGDGTVANSSTPVQVAGISGATQVEAGWGHTCAIISGGTVRCWGLNNAGQLGDGSYNGTLEPVQVAGISGATRISAMQGSTCAIVAGGEARCWGDNTYGQLGNGAVYELLGGIWQLPPTPPPPVAVTGLTSATQLGNGFNHTCALALRLVRCWGGNWLGQLGDGTATSISPPYPGSTPGYVVGLTDAVHVDGGGDHTCALIADGTARCWGASNVGQLGNGVISTPPSSMTPTPLPVRVAGLTGATQLDAGMGHTCAVVAGGRVRCWGANWHGVLGNGTTTDSAVPVDVVGLTS
jgi:alpha-tubulin suppressor-like RCC1 family protein